MGLLHAVFAGNRLQFLFFSIFFLLPRIVDNLVFSFSIYSLLSHIFLPLMSFAFALALAPAFAFAFAFTFVFDNNVEELLAENVCNGEASSFVLRRSSTIILPVLYLSLYSYVISSSNHSATWNNVLLDACSYPVGN